jgi:hypothetical protein
MKIIHSSIPQPSLSYHFAQPLETIAFFDIETTGLSPRASSLYLIGAMYYNTPAQEWHMIQWFADDYQSEAAMLQAFFQFLTPYSALYHFNGAAFDIPYLLAKCQKHNITPPEHVLPLFETNSHHRQSSDSGAVSIDILKEIRPLKKILSLDHANQTSLERWLGIKRDDFYNGGQLIPVYTKYMQNTLLHSPDAEALMELLLLHNHDDMAGMLEVCSIFAVADALTPDKIPSVLRVDTDENFVTVEFTLDQPVPKKLELFHSFPENSGLTPAHLTLRAEQGILVLPLYQGSLKYFIQPHKEYYYFPAEDTAVHKSVAQFMDASTRQKATAATCYTKKEGCFLPSLSQTPKTTDITVPVFYAGYRSKPAYYLLPSTDTSSFLGNYLLRELPAW